LIAGENEFSSGTIQVKDLDKAQQQDVPLEADAASLIAAIGQILGG
jgi:histidyl-tRNA synthetase